MNRKTKIVATLGPASDPPEVLAELLRAGVNVVRINFSHGSADDHRARVARVRETAAELGLPVAVLADLQGPKIRIESFVDEAVELADGQTFTLDTGLAADAGTREQVAIHYEPLLADVKPGSELLINDGAIALTVDSVDERRIVCTVNVGGRLSGRKGVNLRGGGLSASGLTDKDADDIRLAAEMEADYLAVSFVRDASDLHQARRMVEEAGGSAKLCAKIERAEAITALDEIIGASDAVMVARGDLGVEIGDPELPGVQKRIIARAREMNRLVITATQMMESMIENPVPTRAEVLDVANATLDGTDAVMLSAETAVGRYPVATVAAMGRICVGAEREATADRPASGLAAHFKRTDEAIAMATMYTARHMHADAIIALTESGATALLMSRQDTHIPIYALTQYPRTERYLALCRNVQPVAFTPSELNGTVPVDEAVSCLRERGELASGQRVLLTKGDFTGPGGTNAMKIVIVD
ncbi:pyruvate kinase [Salinisphaera orenii]|uniref:Pyruvate kinase n=1 Tax=Salinisphaera orenii YIM 95161 TaxID=1051139 RepID=A0A423Q0G2_9GAMM|nr:pyruvate kinase [Salinisphaera halophila]ROO31733.1 pyruvate kinase [Salinisphaera halophila YIM 95161]